MNEDKIVYTRRKRLLIAALIVGVLSTASLMAQELKVVRDLNLWTGVELEKSLSNKFSVSVEQELRLKKNATEINSYFTQAGIEYQISKNFSLGGKYRFIKNQKANNSYENRSRYCFDLKYKGKFQDFTVQYRMRYQKEIESLNLIDRTIPYEKYFRNKVGIRYTRLKDVSPYFYAELFELFQLHEYPEFKQVRIMAGVKYEPGKIGSLDLEYGIDRELSSYLPYTYYILKLNYIYSF